MPSQPAKKSSIYMSIYDLEDISLMSAPAANAFSDPVITMAPIFGSPSKAGKRRQQFIQHLGIQRIERLRPVQGDEADLATRFDEYRINKPCCDPLSRCERAVPGKRHI